MNVIPLNVENGKNALIMKEVLSAFVCKDQCLRPVTLKENAPFENTSKDSILSVMTVLISMNVSVINVEESAAWSV